MNQHVKQLPVGVRHVWKKHPVCREHRTPYGSDSCTSKAWTETRDANGDRIPTGRFVVRVEIIDPTTNKTRTLGGTHPTLTAARKEAERLRADRDKGLFAALPSKITFRQVADEWLLVRRRKGKANASTMRGYETNLAKAHAVFGDKPVQKITVKDVEQLVHSQAARGLTATTVKGVLRDVRAVLERAVLSEYTTRNVARLVDPTGAPPTVRDALPVASFAALKEHIVGHRNEAGWLLTLAGCRRSEVLGLRWSDFDLAAGTVRIQRSRTPAVTKRANRRDPRTVVGPPKSRRSRRTLALTPDMIAAVKRTRTLRQGEHLAAGVPWDEDAYMTVNEDDRRSPLAPMLPDRYSRLWLLLCDAAGVPRVPLHSARHGSVSRMRDAGVPAHKVAAWHGHSEDVMADVYTHADDLSGVGEAAGF